MPALHNISQIEYLNKHLIKILFDDNTEKIINYAPFIKQGVSSALNDLAFFRLGKVEEGYLVWPNAYDCCPQFLYDLESAI
jgi:Protein of unknown function (DUF2442)